MSDVAFRTISLCAGVGGLDLGVRIARPDARCVAFVEREASAAASLVASMAAGRLHPAAIWSDLRTFDAGAWRGAVDCVLSGDPCQGNSVAGKRLGEADDRWLLDRAIEVYDQSGAAVFFRENVAGNIHGQLAVAIPALERLGCRVACGVFSAAEVGEPTGGERLFILAASDRSGWKRRSEQHGAAPERLEASCWRDTSRRGRPPHCAIPIGHPRKSRFDGGTATQPLIRRRTHGVAGRTERLRHCGNGVVPLVAAIAWVRLSELLAGTAEGEAIRFAGQRTTSARRTVVKASM